MQNAVIVSYRKKLAEMRGIMNSLKEERNRYKKYERMWNELKTEIELSKIQDMVFTEVIHWDTDIGEQLKLLKIIKRLEREVK